MDAIPIQEAQLSFTLEHLIKAGKDELTWNEVRITAAPNHLLPERQDGEGAPAC